jgi:phospholipid-binding lipoprotein MlaA
MPVASAPAAAAPAPPPSTAAPAAEPVPSPTPGASPQRPAQPIPVNTATRDAAPLPGTRDPFERLNRVGYAITQPIDRFVIRPIALTYKAVVPHPLRDGVRNFISNLYEPVVFLNDLLQLRPKRALHTALRMTLNTAVGIVGLFDVAKRSPFHLIHHANGFGDTLGYYGVGPIAYLYLPVIGPTSIRDFGGEVADNFAQPRLLEKLIHPDSDRPLLRSKPKIGKYSTLVLVVNGLDQRAENDSELQAIEHSSVDPYATLRSSYLQDRAGEIAGLKAHDGQAPVAPALDDPLADPAAQPSPTPGPSPTGGK